ncbi:hypothetical protein IGI96_003570 [Enterococcus sp. DIV0421]
MNFYFLEHFLKQWDIVPLNLESLIKISLKTYDLNRLIYLSKVAEM